MSNRLVFVVVCHHCGEICTAYCPERSSCSLIGQAVHYAAEHGDAIELRPSPVTLGKCHCRVVTTKPASPE